jgi:PTS system nitrogen regulatory IIA component
MPDSSPAAPVCAHVLYALDATSPAGAIEQLARGFAQFTSGPAPRALAAAALEREAQAPTFIGHGAALPHARLPGVSGLAFAVGRAVRPILWTPAGDEVRLVFLGVVPISQPRPYLDFVRTLGRVLHQDAALAALLAQPDEAALRAWLAEHLALQ